MRETDNIFDTSTTLMEIDEPPGGDADPRPHDRPAPDAGGEPDYFTPNPAVGHVDARRRALAVLGLVGGGIFMAVLISAAIGSGESREASTSKIPTQGAPPVGGRSATVVGPARAPESGPQPRAAASTHTGRASGRRSPGRGGANGGDRRNPSPPTHRPRHHSPAPRSTAPAPPPEPSYSPEPEPSYSPEPETTYVPTEEAAPPPPPASSQSGGAQPEFGIEP